MLFYCLKCRKNTESKNPKVVRIKNGEIMLLSRYIKCNSKKSTFLESQKARGLLSNFQGKKVPNLSDIPIANTLFKKYKMNAIVNTLYTLQTQNTLLLARDKFILEMRLRQLGFTYSSCGPFTKSKVRIKHLKKQETQDIFIKMK